MAKWGADRAIWAEWDNSDTDINLVIRPCPFPGVNSLMLTLERGQVVVPIAYFRNALGAMRFKAWMDAAPEPEPPMEIEFIEWMKAFGVEPSAQEEQEEGKGQCFTNY